MWESLNPYALIQDWRRRLGRAGGQPQIHFSRPVIVVGGIHAGGVGKTPVVMGFVESFLSEGRRVGVLSRGYGRSVSRGPIWVCEGSGPKGDPRDTGDEPWLIAWRYPQCVVLVCETRIRGIELLFETGVDIVICDDGFQTLNLKPHRTLVLLPSDPTERDTKSLPMGTLREKLSVLSIPDEVWVEDQFEARWLQILDQNRISPRKIKTYRREWVGASHRGESLSLQDFQERLRGRRIKLVCGLGRPQSFERMWSELWKDGEGSRRSTSKGGGTEFSVKRLKDHEALSIDDLNQGDELLVMTEKDWVKLPRESETTKFPWVDRTFILRDQITSKEPLWTV